MRRNLRFKHLDQAVEEAQTLLENGYTKNGNWNLGQICWHLRVSIEKNMSGYPSWMVILGYPLRPILRLFALPKLMAGKSPNGIRTAGIFKPLDNLDDANEVEQFRQCVLSFLASNEPKHPHPGFGMMSNEKFNHFHASHAAHHLSFLQPEKRSG